MKKQLLIVSLCLFNVLLHANNVHISFWFDKPSKLFIYKPVDGCCNSYYAHDTLDIRANESLDYDLHVNELSILTLSFPKILGDNYIYISPNDTLQVYRKKGRLYVDGGHDIINNYRLQYSYFNRESFRKRVHAYLDGFIKSDDFSGIRVDTISGIHISSPSRKSIENDKSKLGDILRRELKYDESYILTDELLQAKESVKSEESLKKIDLLLDSIYRSCPIEGDFKKYHTSLYFIGYYEYLYSKLNKEEHGKLKSDLIGCKFTYEPDFMLASSSDVLCTLFESFIFDCIYHLEEFDKDAVLEYIHKRFPGSETYSICKRVYEDYKKKNRTARIITGTPSNLKELSECKELAGKFILVDLWATWCVPCMMEFAYKDQMEQMLSQFYNQVSLLYISIDSDKEKWQSRIKDQYSGLHLLSSKELFDDIESKVYNNSSTPIPRYFLLSPKGDVLNNDLTRPSLGIEIMQSEIKKGIQSFIKNASTKK